MLEPEDSEEVQSVLFDLLPFTLSIYEACLAVPPAASGQPKAKRPPLIDEKSALVLAKVVFCLAGDGVGPREAASIAGLKHKDDSGLVQMSLHDFQMAIARVERARQFQREKANVVATSTAFGRGGAATSAGAGSGGGAGASISTAAEGGGASISAGAAAAGLFLYPDEFILAATRAAHLADGVMQRILATAAPGGPASRVRAASDASSPLTSEGDARRTMTNAADAGARLLSPRPQAPDAALGEEATLAGAEAASGRASPAAPDLCGLSRMAAAPEHLTEYFKTLNLDEDDAVRLASLSTAHGVDVNLLSGLGQRSMDIKRRKDYFAGTAPVTTSHKSAIETMGSMIRGN